MKTFEDFMLGGRKHKHMKEVVYRGFRGTKSEVAFVMKLVKYAVMLEQMIIVTRPVFPQGGGFIQMGLNMYPQVNSGRMVKILQKKAASKKVAITCLWCSELKDLFIGQNLGLCPNAFNPTVLNNLQLC